MTTDQWNKVYEAFTELLDQKPEDRASYLSDSLGHDPILRDEVARLLSDARQAESEGFLKGPAWIVDDIPLFLPDFQSGDSKFSTIEYTGHGGMGVVYKAYQSNFDRWVALKLSSPRLTSSTDIERFRAEAQSMARLRHPNIVTVHETGEYHGRPYFVMDLIEGNSLGDRMSEFAERPKDAAALVQQIALAVHHAHQRRVLHNDLKPANILLDQEGNPHVTDFGLARRFGPEQIASASGAVEGTASYMSPEQAEGKELTTASDVYGLGAILYALLTEVPPFHGQTVPETLQRVRTERPRPPRMLNPKIDATLEAICLKCLKRDKSERYASANSLAMDIGRYLAGKETLALPWRRRERFAGWCRRNPMEAGLAAAVTAIWIFALVMAVSVARTRRTDLLEAAITSVSFAAKDLAITALLELRSLSRTVETTAANERVAERLGQQDYEALQPVLERMCSGSPSPFTSCYIENADGVMVAHAPPASDSINDVIGMDVTWRDHFRGAQKMGLEGLPGAHISRVYRGRSDNLYKFAISAPILDSEGRLLGVISTSVATDAKMGLVDLHAEKFEVVLIGPRDVDGPEADPNRDLGYAVLFHPGYRRGVDPAEFDRGTMQFTSTGNPGAQLEVPDHLMVIPPNAEYYDPVSTVASEYGGRWIAGFAPIGKTGFIVIVQQRFDDAVSLESSTFWRLALWSAIVSCVALGILAMSLWNWAHSRKLERVQP